MRTIQIKKFTYLTTVLVLLLVSAMGITSVFNKEVEAAGVALTATPSEFALSTATNVTFTWTASTAIEASSTTFTFVVSPAFGGALADCTAPDTQADTTSGGTGSFGSFTTSGAVFTTSNATTTTGRSLCLRLPSTTPAASYSIAMISSATNDYGAALVHVGDNNDVAVTAFVGPTLSFNIRALDDSADTNACDLGSLTTATAPNLDVTDDGAGECGYALAIGTNSASGFQATIVSNTAGGALISGGNSIDAIADADGTPFAAGTEEYGLANVTAATGVSENNTASFTFQTDASPIPATGSPQNFVSSTGAVTYTAGSGATDTTRVVHGASISTATATGVYAQTVTYAVTSSF